MTTTSTRFGLVRAACALALAAAACTTNGERSDLIATKVVRPTAIGATAGCQFDPTTTELVFGSVDPSKTASYTLGLVVENHLVSSATLGPGRLDTNGFQVEQIRTDYEFPDPAFQPSIGEHVVPANSFINTGNTGVIGAELFPPDVIGALKAAGSGTIRVKVRAEGHFLDGSSAKSSTYEYAVQSCAGCGVAFTATCTLPQVSRPCAAGQDSDSVCVTP